LETGNTLERLPAGRRLHRRPLSTAIAIGGGRAEVARIATHWVPQVGDALITYTLAVELPTGWKSVSEGERISSGALAHVSLLRAGCDG
jgi:hypothetical protein